MVSVFAANDSVAEDGGSAAHFAALESAYRSVGDQTWANEDFAEADLRVSRELFEDESLAARAPRPRRLEVYALLSGLPFPAAFTNVLTAVQRQIGDVLGGRLHYWVAPENLGVEYCVFKWPTELLPEGGLDVARAALRSIRASSFRYQIGGVQINPDGCVVAKGLDAGATMFDIRARLRDGVPFLPERQSRWAHVPLGRILEPVGATRFARLRELVNTLAAAPVAETRLSVLKLVHETRWYMEERNVLEEYALEAVE